ncbi:HutD family protein [Streptomyces sp. NPDC014889]|uniref:HutD/Ves family protein n=1 Tax=Streptomyces sp. NPDC014889 TaxID=3364928 RepID=UPI0037004C73
MTVEKDAGTTGRRVFRAHDRAVTHWKNGGGLTREIAADASGVGTEDFVWRLSLADIARGGPFSSFAGVDRIITVVDGAGIELTVDGRPHTLAGAYEPFPFPGDAVTDCRLLSGPVTALNVMTRHTRATAHVRMAPKGFTVVPRTGVTVLVVALTGTVTVDESGLRLDRFDAVLFPDRDTATLRVDGTAAVVTVTTASGSPGG